MHIILINPPHPYLKQPFAQAPLGMLYVSASLEAGGHDVEVIDLTADNTDALRDIDSADLYGLTGMSLDSDMLITCAKILRQEHPKAPVLIGGPCSLTMPLGDYTVVKGEGEEIIHYILSDYPKLEPVYNASVVTDLDSVAFPARHLIKNKGGNIFAYDKRYSKGETTTIISGRGCPYACAFCASPALWGQRVRYRSPENVAAEVKDVILKFGITEFRFSDDSLTSPRSRLMSLCEYLKDLNIYWRASIRVVPNDVEMFKAMKDAGCMEVSFGIESADPHVLKVLKKKATVEDNRTALINADKAGLTTRVLLMSGTPGETKETVTRNIKFLENTPWGIAAMKFFVPLPGSDIWDNPDKYDCAIIDRNLEHYNYFLYGPEGDLPINNTIKLNSMTLEELTANKQKMKWYIEATGKASEG